jgi:BASS family bile acid:Na+ symporter
LAAILKEFENIGWFFALSGPAALLLNVVMMGGGYLAAHQFGLDVRQRLTIAIETGIQNGTLGILIAATLLENSTMTIPVAIYSLMMFGTAALMVPIGNRLTTPRTDRSDSALPTS